MVFGSNLNTHASNFKNQLNPNFGLKVWDGRQGEAKRRDWKGAFVKKNKGMKKLFLEIF